MRKRAIINIRDVSKVYTSNSENIISLDKLNLTIYKGEKIGLIGNNGAGKTTLLRIISGISKASSGRITVQGKVASLIELSSGFHPDLTGLENVYLSGLLLCMTRNEINQLLDTIIKFSELSYEVLARPTHTYSSGMLLRLGFSIAVHSNPDILVIDENIVVGDQDFQKKAYDAIEDMFHSGKTIILSTHLLSFIKRLCGRVIWLKDGKIHKIGEPSALIEQYKRDVFNKLNLPMRSVAAEAFQLLKSLPIGEEFFAEANSSSMEPTILKGEIVKIKRVSMESLKKGDIIAYWNNEVNSTTVHRFYRIDDGEISVKGDNNLMADVITIDKENLLGIVVEVVNQ